MKCESQNGCFKEKSTSNFLKNEHFLPPDTHTFSFFWKIWRALFSWNTRFEIRPSALLSVMFQLPLNLSFKLARIFRKKISISFSIFLQMHTFFLFIFFNECVNYRGWKHSCFWWNFVFLSDFVLLSILLLYLQYLFY